MNPRQLLWIFLPLAVGVAVVSLSANGLTQPVENFLMSVFLPIQKGFFHTLSPVVQFVDNLGRMHTLVGDNERQQKEIERLSAEVVRLREVEAENERLRVLVDYKTKNPQWQFTIADVIGREPGNLMRSITLDKGTKDGVMEGMVVMSNGSLVGKVTKSYDYASKVLLISDSSSSVNAVIQRSRAMSVVQGQGHSQLTMRYVAQGEVVQLGDLVVTSGLGGGFPSGLLIGQVTDVKHSDIELFQELVVQAAIQGERLTGVQVITNFIPAKLP